MTAAAGQAAVSRGHSFLRAAHYFADGWPLDSLLVMRQPGLRRDLGKLRRMGFNTLVVVVPWQGFQTGQEPPAYDSFYQDQLRLVLDEARRQALSVLLRVSYVHQVMPEPTVGGIRIVQGLLTREAVLEAWLDYHRVLHGLAAEYTNCAGMFLSWEEFWHTFTHWQRLPLEERRDLASRSGFLEFLQAQAIADIDAIPESDGTGHRAYHHFSNLRFREYLEAARAVNPLLGVEYRVDRDRVCEGGQVSWLENDAFHDWEPRRYSYWAPFVGSDNVGEALDGEAALRSLEAMLTVTSDGGRLRGQVIEQFNFIDDTPQYADTHAAITPEAVPQFLDEAAALLASRCGGYGLWAPRDYRCNILYNAAFLDGARGWHREKVRALRRGVRLERNAVLAQHIAPGIPWIPRMHPFSAIQLELRCGALSTLRRPRLRAQLNRGGWAELQAAGGGRWTATLPVDFESFRSRGLHFKIENDGPPVRLRRVQLYHLVYRGGVMRVDGSPGPHAASIERFNRQLTLAAASSATGEAIAGP